jgi:hypothetical protein
MDGFFGYNLQWFVWEAKETMACIVAWPRQVWHHDIYLVTWSVGIEEMRAMIRTDAGNNQEDAESYLSSGGTYVLSQ